MPDGHDGAATTWRVPRPAAAERADVEPPKTQGTAGAELRGFEALRVEEAVLVSACVATPLPGWVEDMRPSVVARARAFTAKLAERATGIPVELRGGEGAEDATQTVHAVAGAPDALGTARTVVAFERVGGTARVLTCGVACAEKPGPPVRRPSADRLACARAVAEARLEGASPPPPPGVALGAVAWAVHHPSNAAVGLAIAVALGFVAAVTTRRRPRFRG